MTDDVPELISGTLASALDDAAQRYGARPAFFFEGRDWAAELTFGSWRTASQTVAAGLACLGVQTGDRVALLSPGSPIWPVIETACSHLGAVLVPINVRYRQDELAYIVALTEPAVIFTVQSIRDVDYPDLIARSTPAGLAPHVIVVDAPQVALTTPWADTQWGRFLAHASTLDVPTSASRADDVVLLQFTSGTTSFPKGALLSSRAALGATWHLGLRMGITENDRFLSTQPFYHVGGSVATTLPPLVHGCTMVVPERYEVEEIFRLIPKYKCTVRTGQAAMYAREFAHPDYDDAVFASLERGWASGTPQLKRMIVERMGISGLISTYGLTETAGTCTAADHRDPLNSRLEANGSALPGLDVVIGVDGATTTSFDIVGEVLVRGWALTDGYYRDPEATAQALDADGWFHTGDLGAFDGDGNLRIIDRLKDMIKPGGENVSAAEVERVIAELPAVSQVAVVGMNDRSLGEVPVAFVELLDGETLDEVTVQQHCRDRIASFKVPRKVVFVTEWPMTESGKIQKHVLRSTLSEETDDLVGRSG